MTVKELKEILNNPMLDENLDIGYNDNEFGFENIEDLTEVLNAFNQIVGYILI